MTGDSQKHFAPRMLSDVKDVKILVLTGPTASGKSEVAVRLAESVGGEIVSADSMQVYKYLDIGTAKPSLALRERVPHHLLDVVAPDEPFHAARFVGEADRAIRVIAERGRVPVVCGGTALYLKALLFGLADAPGRDEEVRKELEARWDSGDRGELWEELRRVDPELATRLHPNDRTRIVRALEVWRTTGRPLSTFHRAHRFEGRRYQALCMALYVDRQELYRRINERTIRMVGAGWVDEVRRVLAMGYSAHLPPLRAIGYREICAHVMEKMPLETAIRRIQRETRRFAKRQMTWFRRMELAWFPPHRVADMVSEAKKFLQSKALSIR